MMNPPEDFELLIESLSRSRSVSVMTGAGISAESGVPTFRGEDGLWKGYDPMQLATPEAFERDPMLVWEWYDWRRGLIAGCDPNPAHKALVALEKAVDSFHLITQNVDGLHALAGSDPDRIIEFHGNIWKIRCLDCAAERLDRAVPLGLPPRCAECGGLERPGVVWFGEAIPEDALARTSQAIVCDVMLVIGTSGMVEPAASLSAAAGENGAYTAEINLEPTPVSQRFDAVLYGKAGEILPKIVKACGWG